MKADTVSSVISPIQFLDQEQVHHLPVPLARLSTCGMIEIAVLKEVISTDPPLGRYQVIATHTLRGRGAVPALMLLKLLASQPHRFGSKDWLSTQMHEEMERGALIRLDTMASQLRTLLGFGGLDHQETSAVRLRLVEYLRNGRGSGPGYRLAPSPLVWLDTEALAWNVEQAARMQRFGEDALPWWERAYALASRGAYLPDDLYSGWAADKRAEVEGALRQSVHALARIYLAQQGGAGAEEAMRLLRSYWLSHKTDEDVLRPLMELLGKDERYQEAEAYYQQLCEALDATERGKQPDDRTRDIREFLRTRQIQRTPKKEDQRAIQPSTPSLLQITQPYELFIPQRDSERSGNSLRTLPATYTPQGTPIETVAPDDVIRFVSDIVPPSAIIAGTKQLQNKVYSGIDSMQTRRQILHHLLMVGSTALVLSPYAVLYSDGAEQFHPSVIEELEIITASYWHLRANASLDLLGNISEHFRTVVNLLQQALPSTAAERLCSLSGETAQLLGQTLFDLREYTLAWSYYMFSLKAAQTASNHDLWAAGIGRMILLLIYWEHPQKALSLLQEARQLQIQNSRVICWLAAVEAEVHAHLGNAGSCDAALKRAKEILQNEPLGEDHYATGLSASRLAGYEGACFVRLHQPDRALPALQQALLLLDPQAIRRQSTLLTDMGIAYAQQGNIQKACQLAVQALSITKQTRSRAVLERVRTLRSELEAWKETNEVHDLEKQLDTTSALITM